MASPNPLTRTSPLVHLPLILLSTLFALPLLWLLLTAIQPREQVGKVPPEWLPRQFYIELGTETVPVTPPLTVGTDKLVQRTRIADRVEQATYPARFEQTVPAHFVTVKEWFLSKYTPSEPRVFYVEPSAVKRRIAPVAGNYPEAVRALTAREKDKARPLGELLRKSSLPWTRKGDPTKTITFVTYLSNTLLVALLSVI